MTRPRTAFAFAVAATGGVALCARVASGPPILESGWSLLAELGAWAVLWALGVAAAVRLRGRYALAAIVAAGAAIRVAALAGPPVTSDDFYRYAWDGRAQDAGHNPYAHVPVAPAVANLREPWLWPDDAGCAELNRAPGCTRINRPGAPTIYPPVAEAWFGAVYRVSGVEHRHKPWQLALTEVGVLAVLPFTLRRFGRDARWIALYALSPAPALEIVNNAHVDGLAVLLVLAAVAVAGGRLRHRALIAGAIIGAAALVKLFPIVLLVALAGLLAPIPWRSLARAGAAAGAVAALAYLPHIAAGGSAATSLATWRSATPVVGGSSWRASWVSRAVGRQ